MAGGPLQGPAAAASLDRTPYGKSSAGGKIRSSRHHHQNSHLQEQQHRNGLGALRGAGSGTVAEATTPVRRGPYDRPASGRHASAIAPRRSLGSRILTGASSFLSSLLFRRQTLPPPGDENLSEEGNDIAVASTASEDVAIEDILKDRVFTREQCDRFIKVLQSKLGDQPQPEAPLSNWLVDDRYPDEELEREFDRGRDTERRRPPADDTISMDDDEPGTSPIDIAKAYMDKRLSPVPSALPVRTLEYTPVRSREELPRVATPGHTPYVRLRPGKMFDTGIRPTPYPVRNSAVREKKRPVEDDSDYTGRRTRLKITKGPPLSTLPSSSNALGNGSYLDRMRNLQRKRVERKDTEDSVVPVPAQSSETARKILETLEILTPPKLKTLEQELTMVREKRPKELSPSMLNDQARKTLQAIDFPAPELRVEPEKRPADEPSEAPDTRPPAAMDIKGKAVNTSPDAAAGPSATTTTTVPSGSRGFRMNAFPEESNSDDEMQLLPKLANSAPKQPPPFPGFISGVSSGSVSFLATSGSNITTTAVPVVFTSAAPEVSKATTKTPAPATTPAAAAAVVSTTALPVMFPATSTTSTAGVSEASTAFPAFTFSASTTTMASPIVSSPNTLASVISTQASESTIITPSGFTGASTFSSSAPDTKVPTVEDSPATGFSFGSTTAGAFGLQTSTSGFQFGATAFAPAPESKPVSTDLPAATGSFPGLSNSTSSFSLLDSKISNKTSSGEGEPLAVPKSISEPAPVLSGAEVVGMMANGSPGAAPREAKKLAFSFGTGSAPPAASSTSPASSSTFTFTGASSAGAFPASESTKPMFQFGSGGGFAPLSPPSSSSSTPASSLFPTGSSLFPSPVQFPAFSPSSSANNAPFTFGTTSSFTVGSSAAGIASGFTFTASSTPASTPSSNAAAGAAPIFPAATGSASNPFSGFTPTPAIPPASSSPGSAAGNGGDMDMGEDPSTAAAPAPAPIFNTPAPPFIFGGTPAPAAVPAPSAPGFTASSLPAFGTTPPFGAPIFGASTAAPGAFGSNPFASAPAFGSFNSQPPPGFVGTTPPPFGAPQAAGAQPQFGFTIGSVGTESGGEPAKARKIFRAKRTGAAKRGGK